MSELNKDKAVITEGRRNPLKGVDAPLRDQVVEKLFSKLDEMKIGQKVENLWTLANSNRVSWFERQKLYLSSWDEHLIPSTSGPFDGSSQLHIPMPFIVCKTLHARFIQALWSDPPVHTKAENEASIERVPVVQDTMRYYLIKGANYYKGARRIVDQWVWDWVTQGSAVLKLRWDTQYTRFVDVQSVTENAPPKFTVDKDGNEVAVPMTRVVEKEVARTKKTFDGPCFELVDLEDIVIIGGGGDPDCADAVIHRQYLTASELWTLADRKIFRKEAVEKIINGGNDAINGGIGNEIKTQRAMNAGKSDVGGEEDLDRYEIFESYLQVDVDGSGINSDVVVWTHGKTRELCRATYLYRINEAGTRPFAKADFHLRKGQEFGTGMPELLYPLSKEMDAMHNMRVDFGLISVMPFGFYRATSGIDPKQIKLEPGMLIPCDNPQTDVFFPNLGNRTIFGFQEEQALQTMIERLTSISDVNLGVVGGQGVTRTASGARLLNQEMSSNLDVYLGRLNEGWGKALRYLLNLLQQRIPAGLSFRVTGDDGANYWRIIKDRGEIAGQFDIEVSPNSATSNAGIQQEAANQIMQITSNPLDIQLGIVTAAQRYEALKNWYMAMNIRDWGRYLQKPAEATRILTPLEEADRVLIGIEVPIDPRGDHEGFIKLVQMFKDEDQLNGQFSPEQMGALVNQAKKHIAMMQALQAQAAQQANAQQMQINSQQAGAQAPTGVNPMAGGSTPAGQAPNPGGQA